MFPRLQATEQHTFLTHPGLEDPDKIRTRSGCNQPGHTPICARMCAAIRKSMYGCRTNKFGRQVSSFATIINQSLPSYATGMGVVVVENHRCYVAQYSHGCWSGAFVKKILVQFGRHNHWGVTPHLRQRACIDTMRATPCDVSISA